jgi:MFS family permease
VRNYRLYAAGQVVSLTGTWGQRVAQDWLVLELSHGNGVALGVVTGLQFLPVLLLGLWSGVLADRYDKRRLLFATQTAMAVLALALAVLDLSGTAQLWQVFLLALLLGVASALDMPVRQSFVVEMVGPDDLANAVSLNSATFNSARLAGPALAGAAIASIGTGWVFLANAVSYAAVIAGLAAMRPAELHSATRAERNPGQLVEGLRYVRARVELLVPIVLVGVVGTIGLNYQVTLALLAREVFHRSAGAYGVLLSALAAGSLLGALGSARASGPPRQRRLFVSALVFAGFAILVGLAPSYLLTAVLLVPTGAAVLTFTTTANAAVQLGSAPALRGRVMALYLIVFTGGTPVGAPLVGAVAHTLGARAALVLCGAVTAVCVLAVAAWTLRVRTLRLEPHLVRRRPHVHVRVADPAR